MLGNFARFIAAVPLVLMSGLSLADVITAWDWHKIEESPGQEIDKTNIHYCIQAVPGRQGLPTGNSWKAVVDAAAQKWTSANTGWSLEPTNKGAPDEGVPPGVAPNECQLEVRFDEEGIVGGMALAESEECKNWGTVSPKRHKKLYICVDPTPLNKTSDEVGWDVESGGYDPVAVMMHEIGHALRVDHPTEKKYPHLTLDDDGEYEIQERKGGPWRRATPQEVADWYERERRTRTNDVLDKVWPGNPARDFSEHDIQEAKDSVDRTKSPISKSVGSVGPAGRNYIAKYPVFYSGHADEIRNYELLIPPGALADSPSVEMQALFGKTIVGRDQVDHPACPISWGLKIVAEETKLLKPAEVVMSYDSAAFSEHDMHTNLIPIQGAQGISLFYRANDVDERNWSRFSGPIEVDQKTETITFEISALSNITYGLAMTCKTRAPPSERSLPIILLVLVLLLLRALWVFRKSE